MEAFHTYEIWRDSGTHRFYLDGTLMQSLSGNTTGAAQAFTAFGRKTSTPDQTINAEVDWVKFYNAGRSLIRHYDYSDQTGTNVTNIHDPGTNDATLVNTTAETFWGSIPEPGLGHRIASWSNHHNTPGRRTRPGHLLKRSEDTMVKVILRHICNLPGSEGRPGDVVEVTPELATQWFRSRGASPFKQEPAAVRPQPEPNETRSVEAAAPSPAPKRKARRRKSEVK